MSKAVAVRDEAALAEQAVSGIDSKDLVLPVIQMTQQLSRAVTDGNAESGHFYNTVTGEDYGDSIEFVIVGYAKGRFLVYGRDTDEERTYVASGDVAPDSWPEEYAGQAFVDIPDAEEQWRARANDRNDSHEWGSGPPIVTTHNFVGFVTSEPSMPARVSISRTSAPAAKKILTALRFSGRAPWASTFNLAIDSREKRNKPYFVITAQQGQQTTPDQVESAQALASSIQEAGAFALDPADAAEDKSAKPKTPDGGVAV
jgi:hypothetical protein